MIVSHKYRYVFVELPNTGSTAISQELRDHYAGERVEDTYPHLHKHAYYHLFKKVAPPEAREYFVFSGIRDPMDEAVSAFFRYRTDHQHRYTSPPGKRNKGVTARQLERYRFASDEGVTFADFFRRYYRLPYDNWSLLAHRDFDAIIRFERLAQDFERVLGEIGIEPVRQLPQSNATAERGADRSCLLSAGDPRPSRVGLRAVHAQVGLPVPDRLAGVIDTPFQSCQLPRARRPALRLSAIPALER